MEERKKSLHQLKSIKSYLSGVKTGEKIKKEQYARNRSTKVVAKGIFG